MSPHSDFDSSHAELSAPSHAGTRCKLATSRAEFDQFAADAIDSAREKSYDMVLAIFDIDHLAHVNQDYGFAIGDALIHEVEQQLLHELRPADVLTYLGCGSWAALIPNVSGSNAQQHLEGSRNYIQRLLAIHCATHDVGGLSVATLSCGLVVSECATLSVPDMLQAAHQATLASKLHGGNRTSTWSDTTHDLIGRSAGRRRAQRDAQLATILSLAEALDLRDSDTSNHSTMVAYYAEQMAREFGLDEEHVKRIRVAGLLHDIGKIGVPDSILRKPAQLTDEEWEHMRAHPSIGAHLLASVDAEDIRSWVLAHHERPDGTGYPLRLSDTEIPLEAKILAVADAYEAMTVDRVYRAAPGPEAARAELLRLRGRQFGAEVVSVFLRIIDQGRSGTARTFSVDSAEHAQDGTQAA